MTSVLVVGSGSIGARHARNLASLGAEVFLADPDASRAAEVAAEVGATPVEFSSLMFAERDAVVVASPTGAHVAQASAALAAGARVLVEKPLVVTLDDFAAIEADAERIMVGYNLRLHQPIEQLMEMVHGGNVGDILNARLWFGFWLPDWRPGSDYRESYSARSALGGGVLLDAIHELDLLVWLANGDAFDVVGAVVERLGPLEIDVEDTVAALLQHHDGWVADIALDYLSRSYRRGIEVVGTAGTARLDWARQVVELEGSDGVRSWPATTPVSASYEREAERFLAFVDGAPPVVGGAEGAQSVRLADAIRSAAR